MTTWKSIYRHKRRFWKAYRERRALRRGPPAAWERLPPEVVERLESLHRFDPQPGFDGALHEMDGKTRLKQPKGCVLFELHEKLRPASSLEIGLAYGFSTLYFLASMKNSGEGHHSAIDPFQDRDWKGVGRMHAEHLGMGDRFTCYQELSVAALPKLAAEGKRYQLIFIDGDHRFDGAFMDFCLSAPMLDEGGCIAFDDMWMPSVRRAVSFVRTNREDFVVEEQPSRLAVFRRVGEDKRHGTHYKRF